MRHALIKLHCSFIYINAIDFPIHCLMNYTIYHLSFTYINTNNIFRH